MPPPIDRTQACVVSKEDQEMAMSVRMASMGVLPGPGKAGKRKAVVCSAAGLAEQYRTLRIEPGASEKEVKRAFRQLALQYHPDVCRGSNCGVQFHLINEAYDVSVRLSIDLPNFSLSMRVLSLNCCCCSLDVDGDEAGAGMRGR